MSNLKKIVCEKCTKFLMYADLIHGTISKDCPKCGHRNIINAVPMNEAKSIQVKERTAT